MARKKAVKSSPKAKKTSKKQATNEQLTPWAFQQNPEVPKWANEIEDKNNRFASIIIGIPHLSKSKVSIDWAMNYKKLHGMLGCTGGEIIVRDLPIADARNEIVRQALECGADYIFFLGDDVIAPADSMHRLWCHNKDMVCGVYWSRTYPSTPYLWRDKGKKGPYMDWKYGEVFPVDYSGVDCVLIKTEVFKKMKEPWFSTDWSVHSDQRPITFTTEDFYFYEKAKQLGFDLWVDSSVQCLHQDRNNGMYYGLMDGMEQGTTMTELPEKGLKIADIRGDGEPSLSLAEQASDGGVFHRFDLREDQNPDFRTDGYVLSATSGTYDIVNVGCVLEYFPNEDAIKLLREWIRIGKKAGKFTLRVPNWRELLETDQIWKYKYGYNDKKLRKLGTATKMLKDINVSFTDENRSIILEATINTNLKWESLQENLNE